MSVHIHFQDLAFYREDGTVVAFTDQDGERPFPAPNGGQREAALLIELGVDGMITGIHGQRVNRGEIETVIAELTFLLGELDRLYPADQSRGTCLVQGDWGRCSATYGHEGDHRFPTEKKWRRDAGVGL